MKNIRLFLSENFQFLEVKFSIYLNRRVFVMQKIYLVNDADSDQPAQLRSVIGDFTWHFAGSQGS